MILLYIARLFSQALPGSCITMFCNDVMASAVFSANVDGVLF